MTLVTVLILVATVAVVVLLALAPSVPARRNPFPGRRPRAAHHRTAMPRLSDVPQQRDMRHHAR